MEWRFEWRSSTCLAVGQECSERVVPVAVITRETEQYAGQEKI